MNSISLKLARIDFKGGETVEGQLELEISESIPVRGIRVAFRGSESSSWSVGTGKWRRHYSETHIIFESDIVLHGNPKLGLAELVKDSLAAFVSKDEYEWIQPGRYCYPFSYPLPETLPGDYQSPGRSRIEYTVKGHVDLPLKFDLEATQVLTIYEVYRPEDVLAVSTVQSKSFLFDSGAKLIARASLERNVFFVGETLMPVIEIHNQSAKPVEAIEITLRQVETLRGGHSSTTIEHEAASEVYQQGRVEPAKTESFQLSFAIPTDLYPSIRLGRLVQVSYELAFRFHVPWAADLRYSMPLVLLERAGVPSRRRD